MRQISTVAGQDALNFNDPIASALQTFADATEPALALRGLTARLELLDEDFVDSFIFDTIENPAEGYG